MSRAYYFGNMYLSSIQQGIQGLHCTSEMYLKYMGSTLSVEPRQSLVEWGRTYKTVVLLNGGDCSALITISHVVFTDFFDYQFSHTDLILRVC